MNIKVLNFWVFTAIIIWQTPGILPGPLMGSFILPIRMALFPAWMGVKIGPSPGPVNMPELVRLLLRGMIRSI
jgi:hypothetical protein